MFWRSPSFHPRPGGNDGLSKLGIFHKAGE